MTRTALALTLVLLAAIPFAAPAATAAAPEPLPQVLLQTSQGEIVIELAEDHAPNTVANFITLIEKGFYNGLTFHRVIPGFVAQGGCPLGNGTGGPGYKIPCECGRPDHLKHGRGVLSMAHAGKDTGGSQFFITLGPQPHLDGKHTVFGRVVKGMEVVDKLKQPRFGTKPDVIKQAKVLRKRNHPYKVTKVE